MVMPPLSSADFVRGERDAPLVLTHYGDFECPYSAALHATLRGLEVRFEDQIAVVFRHFPLSEVHPDAFKCALAAQAADERFWEMHDLLFENQPELGETELFDYARQIGLDIAQFRARFRAPETREAVEHSVAQAKSIGLHGTPSLFIGDQFHDNNEGLWKVGRLLPLIESALLLR